MISLIGSDADHAAVAQHGHPIGEPKNLIDAVGDVDQRDTGPAQLAQNAEQLFHIAGRQSGSRLVEHQHFRMHRDGARDADDRPLGGGQAAHRALDVDRRVENSQHLLGHGPHLPPRDQPPSARKAVDQGDVLGDRQVVDQAEILVDEG